MAKKVIQAQMQQRRDTAAQWAASNPVLLEGELGIVTDDPNLYKIGDGVTAWNDLKFRGFDGTLVQTLGDSENAVMSQKAVTEKLTELESEMYDRTSITDSAVDMSGILLSQAFFASNGTITYIANNYNIYGRLFEEKAVVKISRNFKTAAGAGCVAIANSIEDIAIGNKFDLIVNDSESDVDKYVLLEKGQYLMVSENIGKVRTNFFFISDIKSVDNEIKDIESRLSNVENANKKIEVIEHEVESVVEQFPLDFAAELQGEKESECFLNSIGKKTTLNGQTEFSVTTYDVESYEGRMLEITSTALDENAHYSFADADGNIVSFESKEASGYNTRVERAIVPATAKTCMVASYIINAHVVLGEPIDAVNKSEFLSAVRKVDARVSEMEISRELSDDVTNNCDVKKDTYISISAVQGTYYTIDLMSLAVSEGEHYRIRNAVSYLMFRAYLFGDADGKIMGYMPTEEDSSATLRDYDVTVPKGAKILYVHHYSAMSADTIIEKLTDSPIPSVSISLKGKKWVCIGDSLTEHNLRATKNYHDYIAEATGIEVVNMGRSGSGYKRTEDEGFAFYQRVANIPTDADVITIFGSGNDNPFFATAKLGTASDTGTETIGGCVNTTLDNIYARMPMAVVGIISPTPWVGYSPTNKGNGMENYSALLKEICERRGIPFLDLYHCSGLRPDDAIFRSLAYSRDEGNGVHPDENGHKLIAPRFKAFLETLVL